MRVEKDGARRSRRPQLRKNERVAAGLEDLDREPALEKQVAQQVGVAPDVVAIGSHIRNRQQLDELADDRLLVGGDKRLDGLTKLARQGESAGANQQGGEGMAHGWRIRRNTPLFYFPLLTFYFLY